MLSLNNNEIKQVSGGSVVSAAASIWTITAPGRALYGAGMLGWQIGTAIYNTYGDNIQNGLDRVFGKPGNEGVK